MNIVDGKVTCDLRTLNGNIIRAPSSSTIVDGEVTSKKVFKDISVPINQKTKKSFRYCIGL